MAERLLKRLAEKGHYIDVVTHFPSEEAPPRYNQLSVKGTLPTLANNLSINHFKDYSTSEIIYYMMRTAGTDACQKILDTPVLQNIRQSQKKYDLIITHIFGSDCMYKFTLG
ncbi:hypothetical protein MTP99_012573 [Tenebrio molitor]|nr:hypothetical protein MTP99_012573 [Tenebrio molitor]